MPEASNLKPKPEREKIVRNRWRPSFNYEKKTLLRSKKKGRISLRFNIDYIYLYIFNIDYNVTL